MSYKLIALDLDGTLLDSQKQLSPENKRVLYELADRGVIIVPTTGRFYDALPDCIKEWPFLRYLIAINGAGISDLKTEEVLYRAEIPIDTVLDILNVLDTYPVIYDCYIDDKAYISAHMYDAAEEFVTGKDLLNLVRRLRHKVPDLKTFVKELGHDVQKVQLYSKDDKLRERLYGVFAKEFPQIVATSSRECNIELNAEGGDKGSALKALAGKLGIDIKDTIAFGDCSNDYTMIRDAGLGIAMGNAIPELKEIADQVTLSCDESGVAVALKKIYNLD